jgi:uncharacterized membrane protein YozB (DUF420 family)
VTERRVYLGYALAIAAAVVLGFTRTFFLKPFFPELHHLVPPEPIFIVHGVVLTAWFVLLVAQAVLITTRRVAWHRAAGWAGAWLAGAVLVLGTLGSLVAAARPGGFLGVTQPPEQFLVLPISNMVLFGLFAGLGIRWRRNLQAHKRGMLVASIGMLDAAIARWPVDGIGAPSPVPGLLANELVMLAFLGPLVAWDLHSRRRLHPVTVAGVTAVAIVVWGRGPLGATATWQHLARLAVQLAA